MKMPPQTVSLASPQQPERQSASGRRLAAKRVLLAAAALASADIRALAASPTRRPGSAALALTFTAFCDTLIPADEITPAASTLGVASAILADIDGDALAQRLLAAGCAWLDAHSAGDFTRADEATRVAACERMQAMPWESPAGRFFQVMRNTAMAAYYAEPASWRGLALDRPPQPLGFFEAVR